MRVRDVRNLLSAQRAFHPTRTTEHEGSDPGDSACDHPGRPSQISSPSRLYPGISTERIMRAVEQQRRVSQQLEDLRIQQRQRTAFLHAAGIKWIMAVYGISGGLALVFILLLIVQPGLLGRILSVLGGGIAFLLMLEESVRQGLAPVPLSNWLLSGAALLVVLMMGLWVRLMRPPKEA
ncbi:MAG TPA: hypothetical protein VGF67_29425 [Ktedonobacteraceae bacterium]